MQTCLQPVSETSSLRDRCMPMSHLLSIHWDPGTWYLASSRPTSGQALPALLTFKVRSLADSHALESRRVITMNHLRLSDEPVSSACPDHREGDPGHCHQPCDLSCRQHSAQKALLPTSMKSSVNSAARMSGFPTCRPLNLPLSGRTLARLPCLRAFAASQRSWCQGLPGAW